MTAKGMYPTAVSSPRSVGDVRTSTRTVKSFDVSVTPDTYNDTLADEYVLTVNGHVVRHMNRFQAKRLGLVVED
jgi:hypothetical protein